MIPGRGWEILTTSPAFEDLSKWLEDYQHAVLLECLDSKTFDEKEFSRGRFQAVVDMMAFVEGRVEAEKRNSTSAGKAEANARHN